MNGDGLELGVRGRAGGGVTSVRVFYVRVVV